MPRVTVDNRVFHRVMQDHPNITFNSALMCHFGMIGDLKRSRPKKKQNRFMKLVKNIFKGRLI